MRQTKEKEIRDFIISGGGEIIGKYKNVKTPIEVRFACGHIGEILWNTLKRRGEGELLCKKCQASLAQKPLKSNEWEKRGVDIGFNSVKILSSNSLHIEYSCGHSGELSFSAYKKRLHSRETKCRNCLTNEKRDFSKLNTMSLVRRNGGKLISVEDGVAKLEYSCGHQGIETLDSLKRKEKEYGQLLCTKCSEKEHAPKTTESKVEKSISSFCRELGIQVKTRYRVNYPNGLEIDSFIPSLEIGIEVDGVYWHSEGKGKGRDYHINKKKYFSEHGIELMQFLDIEIENKSEIVRSMIKNKLGLNDYRFYARKTSFSRIQPSKAKEFLDKNHLQGGHGSTRDSFGLFVCGNLVSVMSFKKRGDKLELYRFANKINTSVVGSFSKLFKNSIKEMNFSGVVITFADLRFSSLDPLKTVYAKNGFRMVRVSLPNYKYFKNSRKLYSRIEFQKHKLSSKLKKFDKNKTEAQNMRDNGFDRIFDCGNMVFEFDI